MVRFWVLRMSILDAGFFATKGTEDRRRKADGRLEVRQEWGRGVGGKSEARNPKSETNSNYQIANDQNGWVLTADYAEALN
jgi:hypothetical protein